MGPPRSDLALHGVGTIHSSTEEICQVRYILFRVSKENGSAFSRGTLFISEDECLERGLVDRLMSHGQILTLTLEQPLDGRLAIKIKPLYHLCIPSDCVVQFDEIVEEPSTA